MTFVFCIDGVKAYTIYEDDEIKIDEEYIYSEFIKYFPNFNIEKTPYIFCNFSSDIKHRVYLCVAFNEEIMQSMVKSYSTSMQAYEYWFNRTLFTHEEDYFSFSVNLYSDYLELDPLNSYNLYFLEEAYTNFDIEIDGETRSDWNLLDFSNYGLNLEFNENLFKDNPNFKQVCVEEGKSFAITPTKGFYKDSGYYNDFIWFPYGLNNGLYKTQYDSSSEYFVGNIIKDTEEVMYEHFYFSSKDKIYSFYDFDLPSNLENAGYIDKYSYYGYDAYMFSIFYREEYYRYPIFTFDNPSKTYISSSGTIHGGGGLTLGGDKEIEISSTYCFYIKNEYDVSIVNRNEWGDFNGTVSSPDGEYDFNTSYNEFNSNTESFLSQPIKFINSMKDTINFINSLIYDFYMSLPVLLRTFIITVFIILIIMLIMKIGGYS